MINLFRQDLILIKKSISSHLLWILFVLPFIIVSAGGEGLMRSLSFAIGYFMIFFSLNLTKEEVDDHIIIGYLPVNNREIVVEKYILFFLNYILGIFYCFILVHILSWLGFNHIEYLKIGILPRMTFILFLASSLILPLYFYLTRRWFTFWSLIVYVTIINISRIIIGENPIFINTSPIVILVSIWIIYILSMISSIYIYKNRDIG